jgi:hypothetical protein
VEEDISYQHACFSNIRTELWLAGLQDEMKEIRKLKLKCIMFKQITLKQRDQTVVVVVVVDTWVVEFVVVGTHNWTVADLVVVAVGTRNLLEELVVDIHDWTVELVVVVVDIHNWLVVGSFLEQEEEHVEVGSKGHFLFDLHQIDQTDSHLLLLVIDRGEVTLLPPQPHPNPTKRGQRLQVL